MLDIVLIGAALKGELMQRGPSIRAVARELGLAMARYTAPSKPGRNAGA